MRNRTHHGPDAGWRFVFDRDLWRQGLAIGTLGAVSMALFACAVALARDTTGHDWYAAAKLTVAELMIGAGFDKNEPIEFRNENGVVETVARSGLSYRYRVLWARGHILKTAWDGATLGGLSGLGGALLCFVLIRWSMDDRRGRRPASEPARRREAREPLASPQERPMSAPTHAPTDRPPASPPPLPAKPEPTAARQVKPKAGKDDRTAPARRQRRKRDHGRWV